MKLQLDLLSWEWCLCIVSQYEHVYCTMVATAVNIIIQCVSLYVYGHHKLIRWKMVTHAEIDRFSRMIMFMKCSTNNEATAV